MEGSGLCEGDDRDDGEVGGFREIEFYTVLVLAPPPSHPRGRPSIHRNPGFIDIGNL